MQSKVFKRTVVRFAPINQYDAAQRPKGRTRKEGYLLVSLTTDTRDQKDKLCVVVLVLHNLQYLGQLFLPIGLMYHAAVFGMSSFAYPPDTSSSGSLSWEGYLLRGMVTNKSCSSIHVVVGKCFRLFRPTLQGRLEIVMAYKVRSIDMHSDPVNSKSTSGSNGLQDP